MIMVNCKNGEFEIFECQEIEKMSNDANEEYKNGPFLNFITQTKKTSNSTLNWAQPYILPVSARVRVTAAQST
jgi:hypothetical protein